MDLWSWNSFKEFTNKEVICSCILLLSCLQLNFDFSQVFQYRMHIATFSEFSFNKTPEALFVVLVLFLLQEQCHGEIRVTLLSPARFTTICHYYMALVRLWRRANMGVKVFSQLNFLFPPHAVPNETCFSHESDNLVLALGGLWKSCVHCSNRSKTAFGQL